MTESTSDTKTFNVMGIMSGTSLDGVDIAQCCFFSDKSDYWNFQLEKAYTYSYDTSWKERLIEAERYSGLDLIKLHKEYGTFLGSLVNEFLKNTPSLPEFIASHGHTIFHQPENRLTFQLGDGAYIAAETGITTISDFRNLDVALGGQGAPLVPIGDKFLFGKYSQCLNLGGFANISYDHGNHRIAYDICPVNIVLNYLTSRYFHAGFDKEGHLGQSGIINKPLLTTLNQLPFYKQYPPKSLGKEWVTENFLPLTENNNIAAKDILRTVYEHIAHQLSSEINAIPGDEVLVTGGGTFNKFLIQLIKENTNKKLIIPQKDTIDFKEAIIFAFLGVLRMLNKTNCLSTVTGASRDNVGGIIHLIK
ncbi:MAG: anhydro-N-acetylmuramic acid kinase [Bacteroidales bacterium]|nr:anhydro-N-acetylmuramic acid kinase [Bacteroidales bacterium]